VLAGKRPQMKAHEAELTPRTAICLFVNIHFTQRARLRPIRPDARVLFRVRKRLFVSCYLCLFVFVVQMGFWFLVSMWFGLIVQGP